jgi:hypothetical protein
MIKIDNYVTKEGNIFYLDMESFNKDSSELKLEEQDTIKFNYDGDRYVGTIVNGGGGLKTGIYQIESYRKVG